MRRYGRRASNPAGIPEDASRCVVAVWNGPRGMTSNQCSRKRGHGYKGWLCKQHAHVVANDGHVDIPEDDTDGAAPDNLRLSDDAPEPAWVAAQAAANAAARDDYQSDAPYLTDDVADEGAPARCACGDGNRYLRADGVTLTFLVRAVAGADVLLAAEGRAEMDADCVRWSIVCSDCGAAEPLAGDPRAGSIRHVSRKITADGLRMI